MKNLLFFGLLASLLVSCSSNTDDDKPGETQMVTLSFSPYEMSSFTRTATSISEYCTHLDVWIVNGTDVIDLHQTSGTGFGSMSVALDKTKTYTMYAIAHRCTANATLTGNVISFPESKVTHSLYYTTTFSPSTTTSLSCLMTRIVGMFRIEMTDALPDECTQMKFTVYQTGTTYNIATGESGSPTDKETLYTSINKNNDGSASFTVTIMPDDQTNTSHFDIQVDALAANDDVIETRTFTDVPIKANYKTTYRGTFFVTESMTMSFTADDWNSFDTVNF